MIKDILKGIKSYAGTFKLLSKLGLWKYFGIPIAISIVTAVLIAFFAYSLSSTIGSYLANIWIWDFGKDTFTTIAGFFGSLLIIAIGLILYKHIIMALSAPFMSPVSEKIEAHFSVNATHTHRNTSFREQLWRGIRINVRNLRYELLLTIPILLLGLIPVIGVISTVLLLLVQAYYAGFGNMDYTLERHLTYKKSISFVRKNKGVAIGNGIVFILFLLIPVVGIILVLPLSVTAAATNTISLLEKEQLLVTQNQTV